LVCGLLLSGVSGRDRRNYVFIPPSLPLSCYMYVIISFLVCLFQAGYIYTYCLSFLSTEFIPESSSRMCLLLHIESERVTRHISYFRPIDQQPFFPSCSSSGRSAVDMAPHQPPAAHLLLRPVPPSPVPQDMMERLLVHLWLIWAHQWAVLIIYLLSQMWVYTRFILTTPIEFVREFGFRKRHRIIGL
jgi:hypothetical protein